MGLRSQHTNFEGTQYSVYTRDEIKFKKEDRQSQKRGYHNTVRDLSRKSLGEYLKKVKERPQKLLGKEHCGEGNSKDKGPEGDTGSARY